MIAMALAAAALVPVALARAASPDEIVGFGVFHFGMSVKDALRAAPRARLMRCDFPNQFKNCVDYDDKVFSLPATIRARFDAEQRLDAVYVQFDGLKAAPGSQSCRKTAEAVLNRLRDTYGPNWRPKGEPAVAQQAPKAAAKPASGTGKTGAKATSKAASSPGAAPAGEAGHEPYVWFTAKTGKVGLVDLCSGDDTGMVYVVFTPLSVPGRKAS